MGIEVPADYGGADCNFMTTVLAVEEISKVDPATAALVDIHNTLSVNLIKKLGNEEQKKTYLPRVSQDTVR